MTASESATALSVLSKLAARRSPLASAADGATAGASSPAARVRNKFARSVAAVSRMNALEKEQKEHKESAAAGGPPPPPPRTPWDYSNDVNGLTQLLVESKFTFGALLLFSFLGAWSSPNAPP